MTASGMPLRTLLQPELEIPETETEMDENKRRTLRFRRELIGTMKVGDDIYDIACRNVSYDGVRVQCDDQISIDLGQEVVITVLQAGRKYTDTCTVKWASPENQAPRVFGLELCETQS